MKGKIEVKGNEVLFYENMHLIESLVDNLQEDVKKFVICPTFEDFDSMMRGAEQLHAFIGSMLSFLRYRAFEFDVMSETDTVKEPSIQKNVEEGIK